jgi:hypothetical protein
LHLELASTTIKDFSRHGFLQTEGGLHFVARANGRGRRFVFGLIATATLAPPRPLGKFLAPVSATTGPRRSLAACAAPGVTARAGAHQVRRTPDDNHDGGQPCVRCSDQFQSRPHNRILAYLHRYGQEASKAAHPG